MLALNPGVVGGGGGGGGDGFILRLFTSSCTAIAKQTRSHFGVLLWKKYVVRLKLLFTSSPQFRYG